MEIFPKIQRLKPLTSKPTRALISPFAGVTVWLSDEIGVFGQLWANNSLFYEDDGQAQTFTFDMTPDLRIGLTFRMPDETQI